MTLYMDSSYSVTPGNFTNFLSCSKIRCHMFSNNRFVMDNFFDEKQIDMVLICLFLALAYFDLNDWIFHRKRHLLFNLLHLFAKIIY
jgi:hypothetical protein